MSTSRIVWLVPVLVASVAVAATLHFRGRTTRAAYRAVEEPVDAEPGAQASAEQLRRISEAILALDRRCSALEAALAARSGNSTEVAAEPAKAKDTRSPAEVQRDLLRSFDAELAMDRGDVRARRATAEALGRELAGATQGKAQVVGVECATAFCRATLEQDTAGGGPPFDMNAFLDAAPSLKTEAMFEYETEGTHKRTVVYAAREGQLLPVSRRPISELAGVAAAAPPQP